MNKDINKQFTLNVDIMDTHYEVQVVNDPSELDNKRVGECDYATKVIKVVAYGGYDQKVSLDFAKETLLHEMAHAFLCQTGNNDINDERTVEIMSYFAKFVLKSEYKDQFISKFIRDVDGYTKDVNK